MNEIKYQNGKFIIERKASKLQRLWNYLDSCPGGISTLLVLACYLAMAYSAYVLWQVRGR